MSDFYGFSKAAITFLENLEDNNSREWFEPRKEEYEATIREPALQFIAAMSGPLRAIAPHFTAVPRKSGGSLMRPYRDIRFSPDKTPYKTNVGIQFRHEAGKDVHAPGFYIHIAPTECFLGMGLWRPASEPVSAIRMAIAEKGEAYRRILDNEVFRDRFTLDGESLKRPPQGFDAEHPLIEELKRKDFIASCGLKQSLVTSPALLPEVIAAFTEGVPFVRFLCDALGLPC